MSLNNENNPMEMRVALGAVTADTQFELKRITKKMKILSLSVIDPTGEAEDAVNYVEVKLLRDAAVLANVSTETGEGGGLAAGVWQDAPETDIHDVLKDADLALLVDISGTGALNAGAVALVRYVEV